MLLASASGGPLFLIVAFFFSAIPLHSYAAIRFHKSLRNPSLPVKKQTISGLQFMGFVVVFFGVMFLIAGFTLFQRTKEILESQQAMFPELKGTFTEKMVRMEGVIAILLSLSLIANVILNMRLLRWYFLVHKDDNKEDNA